MITVVIPGVPMGKGRPRMRWSRGGPLIVFTPAKTRAQESIVAARAIDAMAGHVPLTGPVTVTIQAVLPIPSSWSQTKRAMAEANRICPTGRPDLDNMVKLITDGCNGIVWQDDACIVHITANKTYGPIPYVKLTVGSIPPDKIEHTSTTYPPQGLHTDATLRVTH